MVRRVQVVPHDRQWSEQFRVEAELIAEALGGQIVAVHHIGSTAIAGISAKPTIDLLVEVRDIAQVDTLNPEMTRRGYEPKGEHGIVGRRYFSRCAGEEHTHHVHVFQVGDPQIQRHLGFRDYLRAHSEEAQAYGRLKERLALAFPEDIEAYMAGKNDFIEQIDRKARTWRASSSARVSAELSGNEAGQVG
jgi:GrpB-like predicted nucleotidyltransferase (UPF0157 family)